MLGGLMFIKKELGILKIQTCQNLFAQGNEIGVCCVDGFGGHRLNPLTMWIMAVGNSAPDPESADTVKDEKKACPAGHLDLEKQLRQTLFGLCLCRTISFVSWESLPDASKPLTIHLTTSPSQRMCIPHARFANLGSYHFLFIEWPSLISLSAQAFQPHVFLHFVDADLIVLLIFDFLLKLCSSFLSLLLVELRTGRAGIFIHLCNSTQS